MAQVLIIDDDSMLNSLLEMMLTSMGHRAVAAPNLAEGLRQLAGTPFDLVFLDVNLPDGNGLKALPGIRENQSSPQVIIITGDGDPDGAEMAIRSGAWDYMEKEPSLESMKLAVRRALEYREARALAVKPVSLRRQGIVGSSVAVKAALDVVAQAARTESNILITGETGVGKDCFALAIHENSPRAQQRFVVVDCTALPETLVESILFGHEKGAFTGAVQPHEGLIRQAHEGTLFLDEVGELPLMVQKSFLRVLEERRFRPLGSSWEVESDFRLVAASNRDLEQMVREGTFREDLLFRLRAISLHLPPLRERAEDILDLAFFYIKKLCEKYRCGTKGFSPEFIEAINSYPWPGNVRELFNALENAYSASESEPTLLPVHLPVPIRVHLARISIKGKPSGPKVPASGPALQPESPAATPIPFQESREIHDRKYLMDLLQNVRGNIAEACRLSQLSRSYLYTLLTRHQLAKPGQE